MADDFATTLTAAVATLTAQAGAALHGFVTEVAAPMTQDRVPRETNALAESMQISDPVRDGDTVSVVLSYGNPSDKTGVYAIVQEMDVTLNHPNGGQSMYVGSVVAEVAPQFAAAIAERMGR